MLMSRPFREDILALELQTEVGASSSWLHLSSRDLFHNESRGQGRQGSHGLNARLTLGLTQSPEVTLDLAVSLCLLL